MHRSLQSSVCIMCIIANKYSNSGRYALFSGGSNGRQGGNMRLAPILASPIEIKSTLLLYCAMNTHSKLDR